MPDLRADVFLSYARKDLTEREQFLTAARAFGLSVWVDEYNIPVGDDWERDIDDALAVAKVGVCLVSANFLASRFITTTELPAVLGSLRPALLAVDKISERLRKHHGLDAVNWAWSPEDPLRGLAEDLRPTRMLEAVERIVEVLEESVGLTHEPVLEVEPRPAEPLEPGEPGLLWRVPDLGEFHGRDESVETLRSMLLEDEVSAIGVSGRPVGVQGQGGIGKTKLAIRLAHDDRVQRAFPDGVFWVTCGQEPDLVRLQLDLLAALDVSTEGLSAVHQTKPKLIETLANRRALLIVDDVWQPHVGKAFDVIGPRGRLLVTTRQTANLGAIGAAEHQLEVLSPEEARVFLVEELENPSIPMGTLDAFAEAAGQIPLALSLAAALAGSGVSLNDTIKKLNEARPVFSRHPQAGVLGAMLASVSALGDMRPLYQALVAYPEDATIPLEELAILWGNIGDLDRPATEALVQDLTRRSLVTVSGDAVVLHDLQREFLILVESDLTAAHVRLLDAHRPRCRIPGRWWTLPDNEPYLLDRLAWHLANAGLDDELETTIANVMWLGRRISNGSVRAAETDLALLIETARSLLGERLRRLTMQIGYLAQNLEVTDAIATLDQFVRHRIPLAAAALEHLGVPTLLAMMEPPDAPDPSLVRTLEGHTGRVNAVAVAPNGTIITASNDRTVRVWNPDTGEIIRTLEGRGRVLAVAVAPNGTIIAGSDLGMRVWNPDTGQTIHTLAHAGWVSAVAVAPDGTIIAGSGLGMRVWNPDTQWWQARTLEGYGRVLAVAVAPNGNVITGSGDGKGRVWNPEIIRTLKGHTDGVLAVAVAPNGTIITGSKDQTVRVWNPDTGQTLHTLTGHTGRVTAVAVAPNGTIITGSEDQTVRVWNPDTGQTLHTLTGHTGRVTAVAVAHNGSIITASIDRRVRVWNPDTGGIISTLKGHAGPVLAVAVAPNGTIITGSGDGNGRVWNPDTGKTISTLKGHAGRVLAVAVAPNGTIITASIDRRVRVWNPDTREIISTLKGHAGRVLAVAVAPNGTIITGSGFGRVRVWNPDTGEIISTLKGHAGQVLAVAVAPNGTIITGSGFGRVRVWNPDTGKAIRTLRGHTDGVLAVAVAPNGTIITASEDQTVRVWDPDTGQTLHTLTGHTGRVTAVAVVPKGSIITTSEDQTVRVWNPDTGGGLSRVRSSQQFFAVAVSGRRIYLGSAAGLHTYEITNAEATV